MTGALVTHRWCRATGGALTGAEQRQLAARTITAYGPHALGLIRLAFGRRPGTSLVIPDPPDPDLVTAALAAAATQGSDLEGHGLRTWLFGSILAASDHTPVDPELLCVGGITHDVGLATPVVGEDFTLRSAAAAVDVFEDLGRPLPEERARALMDGIVAHTTSGMSVAEGPLGHYLQAGAVLDLTGLRLADLPRDLVREVYDRHPAGTVHSTLPRLMAAEAAALPDGRFALLRRLGFALAVRASPTRRP